MYPKALGLTYIDTLLKATSTQFSDLHGERISRKSSIPQLKDWDVQFEALLQMVEDQDSLVRDVFYFCEHLFKQQDFGRLIVNAYVARHLC